MSQEQNTEKQEIPSIRLLFKRLLAKLLIKYWRILMKIAILAGGFGTRLAEETVIKPKPMVEIGGKPIIWHIMKHYSFYGHNEFVIALGYKG